jgi:hypothetical protein
VGFGVTYVLELSDLVRQYPHMFIVILTFQLIQYRSTILASGVWCCGSEGLVCSNTYAIPASPGI